MKVFTFGLEDDTLTFMTKTVPPFCALTLRLDLAAKVRVASILALISLLVVRVGVLPA